VALFRYAGHGVQVCGANYLVPVEANVAREADAELQMFNVNRVAAPGLGVVEAGQQQEGAVAIGAP
jgi:hypothetical protein